MRSEMPMTTFMSCSISSTVMPWLRIRPTSSISSRFSCGLAPAAGSSSKSSFGSPASARDLEPPLRAVGKIAGVVVSLLPDADEIEQLVRPLGDPRLLAPGIPGLEQRIPELGMHAWMLPDPHVVQGRHVGEQSDLLKGASDAQVGNFVRLEPGDVALPKADHAGRRLVEAGDGVEESRLPGAVGTDQGKDLTGSNAEADVIDRSQTAEPLGNMINVENDFRSRLALGQSLASRTSNTASSAVPFSSSCSRMRLGKRPCGRMSMTTTRMSPKTM